jgi:hypothetical protein
LIKTRRYLVRQKDLKKKQTISQFRINGEELKKKNGAKLTETSRKCESSLSLDDIFARNIPLSFKVFGLLSGKLLRTISAIESITSKRVSFMTISYSI